MPAVQPDDCIGWDSCPSPRGIGATGLRRKRTCRLHPWSKTVALLGRPVDYREVGTFRVRRAGSTARIRPLIESVNVDLGTIDYREPALLPGKSKKQIGAAEDDGLSALYPT